MMAWSIIQNALTVLRLTGRKQQSQPKMEPEPELRLKPCPFCGGDPRVTITDHGSSFITCTDCDTAFFGGADDIAPAWNRRV